MKRLTKAQSRTLLRIVLALVLAAIAAVASAYIEVRALRIAVFLLPYAVIGYDVAWRAVRGAVRGQMLDENFLMFLATVGAFIIGEYVEAVAVMLFYQVGELFQSYAVAASRKSITSLMEICPDFATVVREGAEHEVLPEEVEVGEIITVRAGERVPLDGVVVSGESALNTAALTGESVPVRVGVGSEVLSGSINGSSVLSVRVAKPYSDSTVARILELVENAADKKAKTERFITRFATVYTPVVVALAVLLAVLPPLVIDFNNAVVWADWVYRALNFLVVSCPCALVISVPLAFFGAMGGASKQGILIKGGGAIEGMAKVTTVAMDKTGTITKGTFEVTGVCPQNMRDEILRAAAIAERQSTHPIARSILAVTGDVGGDGYAVSELAGKGVIAVCGEDVIVVGNAELMREYGFTPMSAFGTAVHVARGKYLGVIKVGDTVKADARDAIADMHALGLRTVMLTGDNEAAARSVASEVGVAEYKSGLLPTDKVTEVEKLLESERTAFVGDGINDAPVLMRADVGVAMGGIGSDSAIEAADVVLMRDGLSALPQLKRIAKKTMRISRQNIIFALGVKGAVLVLSALSLAPMWAAIFADVGVAVLAILNSMRMLKPVK